MDDFPSHGGGCPAGGGCGRAVACGGRAAGALVVCDDYEGRWSERDLWYSERDGYQDVKAATPRVETEKHGVKAAVDEWLAAHPQWQKSQPIKGEPVVLRRAR